MGGAKKSRERNVAEKDEQLSYLTQWFVCGAALLLHIWFLIMFWYYKITPLFYFNVGSVLFYAGLLCALAVHWRKKLDFVTAVAAIEIIIHQFLCMALLGLDYGFQQYMIPTAAYMFLYMTESKRMRGIYTTIASASIIIYAVSGIRFRNLQPQYSLSEKTGDIVYSIISLSAFAILIWIVWALSVLRKQNYQEAIAKSEDIGQLVSMREVLLRGLSQEIRTPLNALTGMTEQLKQEELPENAEKKLEYMWAVEKGLLSFTNDVLDLAALEAGNLSLKGIPYDPMQMLVETTEMFRQATEAKKLQFVLDTEELPSYHLKGDENRVRQVLVSLLDNAVRHTKEGSITLRAKCERRVKDVLFTLTVEDTGTGIKPEELPKIFRTLQNPDSMKNNDLDGGRMRLVLAAKLAEWMGGTLKAESTYGKGTRFIFSVPQVKE